MTHAFRQPAQPARGFNPNTQANRNSPQNSHHQNREYAHGHGYHDPRQNNPSQGGQQQSRGPQKSQQIDNNQKLNSQASPRQNDSQRSSFEDMMMIPVYGKKAAAQFKEHETRSEKWKTLLIEGAQRVNPNDPNNKSYNWQNEKVSLQLTRTELPLFIGTLFGFLPSCSFMNHGPQNNKGISLEFQEKQFYMSLFEAGKPANALPISLPEAMMIGHLALTQYLANYKGLDSGVAVESIRVLCQQMLNIGTAPLVKKR